MFTLSSPQLNFFTLLAKDEFGHTGGCGAGCTFGLGIRDLAISLGRPPIAVAVGDLILLANIGLLILSAAEELEDVDDFSDGRDGSCSRIGVRFFLKKKMQVNYLRGKNEWKLAYALHI